MKKKIIIDFRGGFLYAPNSVKITTEGYSKEEKAAMEFHINNVYMWAHDSIDSTAKQLLSDKYKKFKSRRRWKPLTPKVKPIKNLE